MKLAIILLFTSQLFAMEYRSINSHEFQKIAKLTSAYANFVDSKLCSELASCNDPGDLEEFSQYCTFVDYPHLVLCYNAYESEADSECELLFDDNQKLISHHNCDNAFNF